MKKSIKILFILASLASLYFVPWILVKAWILPLPKTVQDQVDDIHNYGFEGTIVYIDKTGISPECYTSGWHNRETKIPAKPNALYKLASIGKLYTAVGITKLVNQRKLSLDKTLAEYLPNLKGKIEFADDITLKMMIQHRSGIPNYTDVNEYWSHPSETYQESLNLIINKPANFKPGESYEYCNTNYLLLGKIMDNALGYQNFKFIQQEVLEPLNMNNTYGSLADVNLDRVMSGYHKDYPLDLKEEDYGMISTAEDLAVFIRALNDGSVFNKGEKEIYASLYEYEHSGWVPGYQSFAKYYKDLDAVVISFYSTTDKELLNWNLSEIFNSRIVEILENKTK